MKYRDIYIGFYVRTRKAALGGKMGFGICLYFGSQNGISCTETGIRPQKRQQKMRAGLRLNRACSHWDDEICALRWEIGNRNSQNLSIYASLSSSRTSCMCIETNLVANSHTNILLYAKLPTFQGYIFRILQQCGPKLCNFVNFGMLFNAVMITLSNLIFPIMQSVHYLRSRYDFVNTVLYTL